VAVADPSERLPCGTKLAALINQVAEGAPAVDPAHQAECPYCRASLGRIGELWSDVRALADAPVRAPRRLLDEVMARLSGPAGAVTLRDATGPYPGQRGGVSRRRPPDRSGDACGGIRVGLGARALDTAIIAAEAEALGGDAASPDLVDDRVVEHAVVGEELAGATRPRDK
jgi:hypothetical protein